MHVFMKTLFQYILLLFLLSSASLGQSVSVENLQTGSLSGSLSSWISSSRSPETESLLTRSVLTPNGVLYGVDDLGQTLRIDLLNGNMELLSVSKDGFVQSAPILFSTTSASDVLAIIPKLFLPSSDSPVGVVRQVSLDGLVRDLFQTEDGWIRTAGLSHNGQLLAIAIASDHDATGSEDRVIVLDVYGNTLGEFSLGLEIQGMMFTESLSHLILYSQNRAGVYDLVSGERTGGASVRSGILAASYIPEDKLILVLGETGVTLVNLDKRSISNGEFPVASRFSKEEIETLNRQSSYSTDLPSYQPHQFIPLQQPFEVSRIGEGEYELSDIFGRRLKISGGL